MKLPYALILILMPAPGFAGDAVTSNPDALIVLPQEGPSESRWQIRSGFMWRNIGKTRFSAPNSGQLFSPPSGPGALGSAADRSYDDGFVNQGAATPGTGLTTFWGYNNASQVSSGSLNLTATGGLALDAPTGGSNGANWETSPYIELVYLGRLNQTTEVGLSLNISGLELNQSVSNAVNQFSVTTIDTYDLQGVIAPAAPYTGPFAGPGPLIGNQPSNRAFQNTPAGTQNFSFASNTQLYSLAIGAELNHLVKPNFRVNAGAGLVINIADWDTSLSGFSLSGASAVSFKQRNSDQEILAGLYLKAGAQYQFTENWGVESFFRYDFSQDLETRVGTTRINTELSGWSFGLGATYSF